MPYAYKYPRPAVCVDIIVFYKIHNQTFILLIQRKHQPFQNCWALPGGFIEMNETLEQSAMRELFEETGLKTESLEQFATYGNPNRDPRGRTISVVFYKLLENKIDVNAGDDAANAKWFSILELPSLAFDHNKIIEDFINDKF